MLRINKRIALYSLGLLATIPFAVQAAPVAHVVVAPQCLVNQLPSGIKILSANKSVTLIEVNDAGVEQLITAKQARSATPCGGFMDVTPAWKEFNANKSSPQKNANAFLAKYTNTPTLVNKHAAYEIKYPTQVKLILKSMNPQDMWTDLTTLTSYDDRYANSDNGVKAANWLKTQVETMAKNAGRTDVSVRFVATGTQYKQPSVVVKIGDGNGPGVVIGGHMDTLSSSWELKPGADDDGSGTVTVLQVARNLINSHMLFKKPIYIVWYSAEELGLIGSSYVVKDFKKNNIPVDAVIQMDMTGYAYKNDPTIWLITDNVNKELTAYLETLVNTYVKVPVNYTQCGYACSDHASWSQGGYTASFPFEASFGTDDPYIHTSRDKMDVLSLSHMTDFAKLGTSFAMELAEPGTSS
jgi:leucyl aminopeptidase